jgi:hypothetical protein
VIHKTDPSSIQFNFIRVPLNFYSCRACPYKPKQLKCDASRISGGKKRKKKAYLQAKIEELETNSKIKSIRDLYSGINDSEKGYQHRTNIVRRAVWLQTPTVFWLDGGNISVS